MPALRASYSIAPEVLQRFNALVPSSERSRCVQELMVSVLERREKSLEAVASEFAMGGQLELVASFPNRPAPPG